jgi:hypothetical protein
VPLRSKKAKNPGDDFELSDELRAWAERHCSAIHKNSIITKKIISDALDEFRRSAKKDVRKDSIPLKKRGHRNRVSPDEFSLFQRCLYDCSQEYEKLEEIEHREGRRLLTQEDMLARLIEHVVLIGFYNSFYMTVGVCQVLHNYRPDETIRIYGALVQYTRQEKELWDFRRQKSKIMDSLDKRFGDFLKKDERSKRDRRYKPIDHQQNYAGIFKHWLNRLKPLTPPSVFPRACVVPPETNNHLRVNISDLLFDGDDPDGEHPYETLRIHALLHPPCFSSLTKVLHLDAPELRWNMPEFNLTQNGGGNMPLEPRDSSSEMTEEDLEDISRSVEDRALTRRKIHARQLSIFADGEELPVTFDVYAQKSISIEVEEGTRKLEVKARRGGVEVPLAVHWLSWGYGSEARRDEHASVVLEGGQEFDFTLSYKTDHGDTTGAMVDIAYGEENRIRALLLALRRYKNGVGWRGGRPVSSPSLLPVTALATLLVICIAAGITLFQLGRRPPLAQNQEANQKPGATDNAGEGLQANTSSLPNSQEGGTDKRQGTVPPKVGSQSSPKSENLTARKSTRQNNGRVYGSSDREFNIENGNLANNQQSESPSETPSNPPAGQGTIYNNDTTRSDAPLLPDTRLLEVRSIYVDPASFQDQALARLIYDVFTGDNGLGKVSRFAVTKNISESNAVLRGSVLRDNSGWEVSVRLVNRAGEVVWSGAVAVSGGEDQQLAAEAVRKLLEKLQADVNRKETELNK